MTDLPDPAAWGLPECGFAPLQGGNRSRVLRSEGLETDWVFKTTTRSEAQLAWLSKLSRVPNAAGLQPAIPHPTLSGRFSHAGWTAEPFVPSRPLLPAERWRCRGMMRRMHKVGFGTAQRPGFAHARGLITSEAGGDVDASTMPPDLVKRCRAAFAAIPSQPLTLVHGDLGLSNIGIRPSGHIVLYDWDEARVDHPLFDLVAIGALDHPVPKRAALAFEVMTCWHREPERAKTLAERL